MRHQWINELGPITSETHPEVRDSHIPEDHTEPEGVAPSEASLGPLLFGFALLFAAICFYLSGLWLPATLCCVAGGAWMGSLLDEDDE